MKHSIPCLLLLIAMVSTILLTGCGIPSVHPLYEEDDLIRMDELVGVWERKPHRYQIFTVDEAADTIEVSDMDDQERAMYEVYRKLYFIRDYEEETEKMPEIGDAEYVVGLLKLGSHYFADFFRFDPGGNFAFPVHIFLRVEIEKDRLVMHEFDEDYLRSLIANRQIRIKHEVTLENNFLLTASPQELKKFIIKYADESEAYRDKRTYTKIR